MNRLEKESNRIKDSILVAANVAITELASCKYGILLDNEHFFCFRATEASLKVAIEKLSLVVNSNRLSIKELELSR